MLQTLLMSNVPKTQLLARVLALQSTIFNMHPRSVAGWLASSACFFTVVCSWTPQSYSNTFITLHA
jgi:hypothetical protein